MGSNSEEMAQESATGQEYHTGTANNRILFEKWQNSKKEMEQCSLENEYLKELINNLQFQVETLQSQMSSLQKKADYTTPNDSEDYKTDEDDLAKETEWIRVKHQKPKKRKTNTSNSNSPSTSTVSPTTSPRRKVAQPHPKPEHGKRAQVPPPIMVERINSYEELYDIITKQVSANQFQVKLISENSAKINAIDSDSYRTIAKILTTENLTYHTYENKQSRPIRVMIKDLHHTCKSETIISNLKEQGFNVIGAINKKSFKTKAALNMFMVTFDNGENIDKVFKITHILGCKVNVEALKSSKMIPQCKNCQSFGHTKTYCSRHSRCVKCAGKHVTTECTKNKETEAKCVNCGGAHPASYRGCIVAKELQSIKDKKIAKPKQQEASNPNEDVPRSSIQRRIVTSETSNTKTYAGVVAASNHPKPQTQNSITQAIETILEKMTAMEHSITSINEKVNKLEGRIITSGRNHQQ